MTTEMPLELRIKALYAVPVPTELDKRIDAAMSTVPVHRSRRIRPRVLAALAVAAILAAAAAGPTFEWFGWYGPFDRLWQISTPVDQSVTADGYRVTVHRAYADRLGVRLAMTVEDLESRSAGSIFDRAEATDARGRVYEGWNWSSIRTRVDGTSAQWARFLLPEDANGDDLRLRVTVTSLRVRLPDPIPLESSYGGSWSFNLDVPFTQGGRTISPAASASASGVTIDLEELALLPSGTLVQLAVTGLPKLAAGSWTPSTNIQHDDKTLDEFELKVGADGLIILEALQVDDLAGHWRIRVDGFWSSGPPIRYLGTVAAPTGVNMSEAGPWVLEFDVAKSP